MPEVTDLTRVAQWAKSSGAPSEIYNAACRLLNQASADTEGLRERYTKALNATEPFTDHLVDAMLTTRDEEMERLRAAKRHLSERISVGQEGWNEIHREVERLRAAIQGAMEVYATHIDAYHPTRMHDPNCPGCHIGLVLSQRRPAKPDSIEELRARTEDGARS